jgi:hypothetical protein
MSEELRLTEDGETRITEDGEDRILEGSDESGVQDMTFANNFQTAHVTVGTMKITFGGFGK